MAQESLSAAWSTDVDGAGAGTDAGWRVTITYATAPAAGALVAPVVAGGTAATPDPADGDGTATSFVYPVTPTTAGTNVDITFGSPSTTRRVTLMNGASLTTTRLARPKLRSITAPMHVNQFFNAVITFEAAAAAVTGPPAVPEIGPSDGLRMTDITVANGTVLSLSGGPMVYTAVINPTTAGATPVVVSFADPPPFPHQAPTLGEDATSSTVYDTTAPGRPATAVESDGPDTLLVNNRKPAPPDNGQWGPGDFDFLFSIVDEDDGSGVRASSISLEDNQNPHVLSFSNIGRTTTADQYAATVSTLNVNIEAGTVVTVLATVSDNSGNEVTLPVGTITLAAKTMTTPPANRAPAFASGAAISDITATAGTAITSVTLPAATDPDSGDTLMYSITPAIGNGLMFDAATRVLSGTPTAMMAQRMYTYTVSDGTLTDTLTFNITVMAAAVDPNMSPEFTVKAGKFVVVVREASTMALLQAYDSDISTHTWSTMPDLQHVFDTGAIHGGGALILKQSGDSSAEGYVALNPGTVGISEINWAIDESKLGNANDRKVGQWVEVHNLNTTDATVMLSARTGAKSIAEDSSINGDLDRPYLDIVTNVYNDRPGSDHWVLPGSNGNPGAGQNFVSAARTGDFDLNSKHDGKFNKRYTKSGKQVNATNSRDGRNKGHWAASATPYARRTVPLGVGLGNAIYENHGTPGRVNRFDPERATRRDARTDINPGDIIINEVSNRHDSNNQYEWIELKNVSNGEINLNNYQISILTGVDKDQPFIYLPNNNNSKIPAGGVLLLVDSDPFSDDDHPLAVGWKIGKNPEDQVPGLASIGINGSSKEGRYLVVKFGEHSDFDAGLPDSGDFILVVRKADNHEGDHNHGGKGRAERGAADLDKIVDIAGYVGGLHKANYTNAASSTNLWPLKQQGGPDDRNRLSVNKVRFRRNVSTRDGRAGTGNTHNDRKPDQLAFKDADYSGIGYKRQVANTAMHFGTPGYLNGARRGKVLDLAMDKLVISEIMLSQGAEDARTTLPQWIEIYNPSPHPVNLGGWRLIIENPRDPIRTINLSGGTVKTILSKQTILVISGTARDIGSDTLPSSTVFASTRVYNVWQHQRNEFDMTSRFDPILNEEAFNITLIDGTALDTSKADQQPVEGKHLRVAGKYYAISDVIGNLDGDPRTNDTPEDNGKMKFAMGMTEDGDRTSLIRIFDNGTARDGTGMVKPLGGTDGMGVARMKGIDSKYSWVHAADTTQRFVRHTWYGDESDWGTPADRGGQILPVELSSFRPALEDGKVVIRWATESELDNAGFNILRSETRNGEYKQVNTDLIAGNGTTGERNTYKWVDATAKPGVAYYYQIEDVSFAGEHQALAMTKLKGLISATNKLTTTWGELKEVQ